MRIVYLNPCGNLGGAETSLRELLASVRAAAPDWKLWLILGEDGPLAAEARRCGVEVVIAPYPRALARLGDTAGETGRTLIALFAAGAATLWYARRLAAMLRRIQPDLIHTNGFKMHVLGAWARPRRSRLVWHIHDYVSKRAMMSRLLRMFSKRSTAAIVNSGSVAEDVQRLMPALRVVTIYNAINLDRFSPLGPTLDLDAASGLEPAGSPVYRVGLIGTFALWKGHKVFIEALARLAADVPVRGYIVGGPIYQTQGSQWSLAELRQEVERWRLTGQVGFTGFLEDPALAMRSLDVVVHASTEPEPFGMVIIEAMACGRPVVASQAGGAAELFTDGEDALGHPPGDAAALASQIQRLICDEPLRRRLASEGRARAERIFHGKRLSGQLLELYGEIAGAGAEMQRSLGLPLSVPAVDK
ncbi:MAG: glycosyltransferase family 4 protein [Acidobacteriia bacterium]|nr:glycosyltransferase family 4 protein [Terriglobia bacterium]